MFEKLFTERYRPQNLEDLVLSNDHKEYFSSLVSQEEIPNLLFAGSPGTGKTTLSKILIKKILNCQYLYINASDENGIDTIRTKIIGFASTKSLDGKLKVVLCDEAESISTEAQKALRNVIEEYASNTRFIFTCNYLFKIIDPIQSRCTIFNLNPPLEGIISRIIHILKQENIEVPEIEKPRLLELIRSGYPDLRRIINDVQKFSYTGTLCIKENNARNLAEKVVTKILSKVKPEDLRRFVIERESEFSNDYLQLLKEMFEVIFKQEIDPSRKSSLLLILSEAMYKDAIVIDKEINWFSTCLRIYAN
jgi:DNA polymerase III delta prime subunit